MRGARVLVVARFECVVLVSTMLRSLGPLGPDVGSRFREDADRGAHDAAEAHSGGLGVLLALAGVLAGVLVLTGGGSSPIRKPDPPVGDAAAAGHRAVTPGKRPPQGAEGSLAASLQLDHGERRQGRLRPAGHAGR